MPQAVAADPRTLQANERTLLAWLRTGLSLITFGFVIARLGEWLSVSGRPASHRDAVLIGGTIVLVGSISQLLALGRYVRIRRALLAGRDAPVAGAGVVVLVLGVAALGLLLAAYVFV